MREEITSDILVEAKLETVDMITELGHAAHGISEAIRQFEEGHNLLTEENCQLAEDALAMLDQRAAETRYKIKQWRLFLAREGGAE